MRIINLYTPPDTPTKISVFKNMNYWWSDILVIYQNTPTAHDNEEH